MRAFVAFTATLFASNAALADYHVDILPPVTPVSIDIYNLHWGILWVCVVIFVIVFGATFWSIRSGPRKLDSSISVISARRGDGIARLPGDESGRAVEKESRSGVQGQGGLGGDPRRQDDGGGGENVERILGHGTRPVGW